MATNKKNPLLEKAKAYVLPAKKNRNITEEEYELARAYLSNEISPRQVAFAYQENNLTKSHYPSSRLLATVKQMVSEGKITFKE